MEVAQADPAAENPLAEDPPTLKFTWTIQNFTRLNSRKHYSDIFVVEGHKWRILIFPKGNNVDHFSMYLDVADAANSPDGWSRYSKFSMAVVNQIHSRYSIRKETQHQFNARESDWGFTSFMPLSELYNPTRGYLVNDTVLIEAEVAVRKENCFVGLKNQGATSYMNTLLQTLYHIPYFRKAVYHMPTTENDVPTASIPLALQSLFYKLQYNDTTVATNDLTKSFGSDTYDSFTPHDVQELNRVLCETLEDKMKGTVVEGTIPKLFEGHHMSYIECINVDYKSTRKESFYDLQLDVEGCKDVYASFDKYVEVERLQGDNKYHAEGHDLQDANKGVLFIDFPPVLQLQLKRFGYDLMRDTMAKINDRYEFPLQLDLDREDGKYLSLYADKIVRNLYTLHSVLVHCGGVHGGHYYALIRPTLSDQWYKFDDERVTKIEDVKRALEEQYGGEEELPQDNPGFNNPPFKFTKCSNAYILVYIRESDKDKIICNVDEKDIAEHLRVRLKKEQEDKRKYKAQAHLFTTIKVARDEDISEQIGKNIYFDLVDHEKVWSFRIQKQTPFQQFKEEVAKEFGVPVQLQRFWIWAKRQNHTYRPNRPILPHEELQTVGQIREASKKASNAELKLFLEIERGPDERPIPPPDKSSEDILLFFKLYDPENAVLRYVGRLMVKSSSKPMDIVGQLNQMAGFAPDEEIELFEEIKFEPCVMCEHLDKNTSFRRCQIEDGDIICYQKPFSNQESEFPYPDVPSFLEYVHNREVVRFRTLERPKEDAFTIELSKLHTYDDVVERLAEKLGLDDPSKIRLTSHNCYSQPIKYRGVDRLSDMLAHYNQTSDILYYEFLDIPLPELQGLKTLKVAFHHATKDEVVIQNIRLPKQSTVGDVINKLKTKVELSHQDAELRLLQVFFHKIYMIFPSTERIENVNDQYWTLRAEEIPEEEKIIGPNDRLIHVYHFTNEDGQNQQVQNFGEPFFLVIHEGETLEEIKTRIQKKLNVPDEDFAKWKFAFVSMGRPDYLQDKDVVYNRFQRGDGAWEQYLGLEHIDNAPKRAYAANQDKATVEMECMEEGYLAKIAKVGAKEIQVGEVIPITVDDEEDIQKFKDYTPSSDTGPAALEAKPAPSPPMEEKVEKTKTLAEDRSVPLSSIKGTGPEGRIVKADVEEVLASRGEETTAKPSKLTVLKVPALDYVDIPHTQIRKVTASRLAFSKQTIPQYNLTVDTHVDKMMGLRSQLNSFQEATGGKRISVNDLVIKAAALALRKVPQCNSSWTDEYIRQFSNVNINFAVQTENGLYFPVVKDADKKGLSTIGEEVRFLAQKAKENSLKPEDYEGGTFTVSNLGGPFGIKQFCAVINPPQAAILAIGSAEKRVVAGSGPDQFNVASYMSVTLSCDHRVVDGAIGAEWLKAFKGYIETPESMLL